MNYRCPMCASTNLIARSLKSFNPHTGEELSWITGDRARCDCKDCGHADALDEFDTDAIGYAVAV